MAFIALEGGEGAGKTTHVGLLKETLPLRYPDRTFRFTREPGGTPFAERVRELILSPEGKDADGKTMLGLFMAARADHVRRVVAPALERGEVVICDRFVAATFAYQAHAMENAVSDALFRAHYDDLDAKPDLTIILDIDPRTAQERVRARTGQALTHFDERTIEFHEKLREGYRRYADYAPAALVDSDRPQERVHEAIMSLIDGVLQSRRADRHQALR